MIDLPEAVAADIGETHAFHASRSLEGYLESVLIDGSRGPVPFGSVVEPWQERSILPILHAIEGIAGIRPDYTGPHCFWRDLAQGHDKSSSIARLLNGALAFTRKPSLRVGVFAKDSDQANRIWQFSRDEARLNPWLGRRLQHIQKRIRGIPTPLAISGEIVGGGEVTIYDSDYEGNAGHKLDICICEELTWWPEKAEKLFGQLYTRRTKIDGSVFVVLGNAGLERSWQHALMLQFRDDPDWDYYRTEGTVAGWIDPEKLAADRRTVVPAIARRVYDNLWVSEDELTYLTRAELEACTTRAFLLGHRAHDQAQPGVKYILAIDYAPKKDRTAMAVVGLYPDGTVRVCKLDVLEGKDFPDGLVPIALVRTWIEMQHKAFRNPAIVLDPYQLEQTAQEMEGRRQVHRFQYRGGMANYAMAEHVRTLVVNKELLWPADIGTIEITDRAGRKVQHTLTDEFAELICKDMPYGYRWDHAQNKFDDRCTAVGMAAYFASQVDPSRPFDKPGKIPAVKPQPRDLKGYRAPLDKYKVFGGAE